MNFRRVGASSVFLVGAFFVGALVAHADTAAEIQGKIDAHNAQIAVLQADIASYQKQLDDIGKQKNTLQSAINSLTLSQKQLTANIAVTQNKIDAANLQLTQLSLAIGDKETTINANQEAIAKALRELAQGEQQSIIEETFSARSLTDAWQNAEQVIEFNRALGNDVAILKVARQELSDNRDEVAATKQKLLKLQNDLTVQKKSVDVNKAAQQKLLSDTKNQESTYQKLLADKRAEESRFEAALFHLESELHYALDPTKIPPAGKGILLWPLDAVYITQQFGKTSDSGRLYASGTHNGVDFRAAIGTPVHAAGGGVVMETNQGAVSYCQYGKWVLIRHPNGLATLYAHFSDISVKKGDTVSVGQVIGYSGNTGYATAPHLHLGVYFADAISFTQYACKSGARTLIPIAPTNAYLDPLTYL